MQSAKAQRAIAALEEFVSTPLEVRLQQVSEAAAETKVVELFH